MTTLVAPLVDSPGSGVRRIQSVLATGVLLAVLAAGPALVLLSVSQLLAGRPIRLIDILSVLALVVTLATARHLRRQRGPMRHIPVIPAPVQAASRRLVELSAFGSGPVQDWTITNPDVGLDKVQQPLPEDEADPYGADDALGDVGGQPKASPGDRTRRTTATTSTAGWTSRASRSGPTASGAAEEATSVRRRWGRASVEAAAPLPAPDLEGRRMVTHVVGRGETFWSLAETHLGDGRHWTVLRDLNLGREVAPGEHLFEASVLRQGWEIDVPETSQG